MMQWIMCTDGIDFSANKLSHKKCIEIYRLLYTHDFLLRLFLLDLDLVAG